MTYEEQLKTERWQERRVEIIERDNCECQMCMSKRDLQVHHKKYLERELMAWEYEDNYLITICESCHAKHHGLKSRREKKEKIKLGFTYSENDLRHLDFKNLTSKANKGKTKRKQTAKTPQNIKKKVVITD